MTVHIGLELMTSLVMVDGQRLAHHYSSRVLNSDPYLTDVFPAKEHLRHPVPMDTEKNSTDLAQPSTYQIVGTIGENAQGALVIMLSQRVLLRGTQGRLDQRSLRVGSLNIAGY
jgi:hypothetical protein